ncbi:MAG TPA: phage holin family protein [Jiangellaceae bacterium]|nr:phage holin family protein [Jiangellaceae bacterium]
MAHRMEREHAEASMGELVVKITEDVRTLVRDEIRLAQLELKDKGKQAGLGVGMFGGAGLFAMFGIGALVACAILALGLVMPHWLAALIVGVVLLAIAGVLALIGKSKLSKAMPPTPDEAISGVKKDIDAVKGSGRG